jgi:GntR family phosphonate transport system transcriptional regulator
MTQGRSRSGYTAWRLIAEELRREIVDGERAPGAKLPTEGELAERFGVRLVVSRRGSGTFVAEHTVLVHRIGARTRFRDSLGRRGSNSARLLDSAIEPEPPAEIGERLALDGRPALRLETLQFVDRLPITRATHWFVADLVPGLADHFRATESITLSLRAIGIDDYMRAATTVNARHATVAETGDLGLPTGSVVLVTRSLDVLADGTPLQVGIARFVADRVELDIGHADL